MVSKLKTAAKIFLVTKNWANVWINIFLFKKPAKVIFRNGYMLSITPQTWNKFSSYASFFRHFPNGEINGTIATIKYRSRKLSFDFGMTAPGILAEFFGKHFPYKISFDVSKIRNSIIIDIGASLGDSTIWFAAHGAKKVYAFEPLMSYYKLCRSNIERNDLNDVCQAIHAAIGKKGDDFFKEEGARQMLGLGAGLYDEWQDNIPILTLDGIVEQYHIEKDAFLKLDCEGYEYDILLNAPNKTLRLFKNIMMEYHFGHETLKTKLEEAGFSVQHTDPQTGYQPNTASEFKKMRVGYIFAERS